MRRHDRAEPTPQLTLYRAWLRDTYGLEFRDYADLWTWSTTDLATF